MIAVRFILTQVIFESIRSILTLTAWETVNGKQETAATTQKLYFGAMQGSVHILKRVKFD
jgi:hypothetical protein